MEASDFERQFVEMVAQTRRHMKRQADRAMILFVLLRLGLVAGSASLPALTAFADRRWSTVLAIGVAILAGLDTQFRWGEEWRHFRSGQLALERYRRDYDHGIASLQAGRVSSELNSPADVFERFYQSVTQYLQVEAEAFFKFRIVDWKAPAPGA
jgi:hypothetical protein